jgi:aflatoxin B1 aldehyde reductase
VRGLGRVQRVSDGEVAGKMEGVLRWFMHHSPLGEDAVILGTSSKEQIERSLSVCKKGPPPESLVAAWEEMYESAKAEG